MNFQQFDRLRRLEDTFFDLSLTETDSTTQGYYERLQRLYEGRVSSAVRALDADALQTLKQERLAAENTKCDAQTVRQMAQVEGIPSQLGSCYDAQANPEYYGRVVLAQTVFENGCQASPEDAGCVSCAQFAVPLCVMLDAIMEGNHE